MSTISIKHGSKVLRSKVQGFENIGNGADVIAVNRRHNQLATSAESDEFSGRQVEP